MAHVMFDTLKFVDKLISAGMPAEQAKALSEAQKEVFKESLDHILATKADLIQVKNELKTEITELKSKLKVEIADVRSDVRLLKWMMGFLLAGVGALVLKAFF